MIRRGNGYRNFRCSAVVVVAAVAAGAPQGFNPLNFMNTIASGHTQLSRSVVTKDIDLASSGQCHGMTSTGGDGHTKYMFEIINASWQRPRRRRSRIVGCGMRSICHGGNTQLSKAIGTKGVDGTTVCNTQTMILGGRHRDNFAMEEWSEHSSGQQTLGRR